MLGLFGFAGMCIYNIVHPHLTPAEVVIHFARPVVAVVALFIAGVALTWLEGGQRDA